MSLDRVIDLLAGLLGGRLGAALGDGTRVDDVAPAAAADLPCVALSLDGVRAVAAGIGRIPRGTRTGALLITVAIDLADPVLDLGSGEQLTLLSADRRTLTLPHGPLVAVDGTSDSPLGPEDVSADDGEPFTVVAGDPTGRQVQADAAKGTMRFGIALAAAGTLTVTYHVGQWDVVTTRAQATLALDVTAETADVVRATSRAVSGAAATGFSDPGNTLALQPLGWGPVLTTAVGGTAARTQRLTFDLDAEIVDPVLTTSGGVITTVAVTGAFTPAQPGGAPDPFESFDVTRGAPT